MNYYILKNKAFSFIELLITISILSLLTFFFHIKYENYKEQSNLYEAKIQIVNTLSKYRDLSYYNNRSYHITFNFLQKYISISKISNDKKDIIPLPSSLNYKIITKKGDTNFFITTITPNGNFSDAFSIYIFDYENIAQYRLGFYTFSQIKYLLINTYRNQNVIDANLENISTYHDSSNGKNHIGWIKE